MLNLAIEFLTGYLIGLMAIGFIQTTLNRMAERKGVDQAVSEMFPEEENDDFWTRPIPEIFPSYDDFVTEQFDLGVSQLMNEVLDRHLVRGTANKDFSSSASLKIPVADLMPLDESETDQLEEEEVTLESLKLQAKELKIKGWHFYKDIAKLQQKIKEVEQDS